MAFEQHKRFVEFSDRRTSFARAGSGRPVVVLLSGLGESMDGWSAVFEKLSQRTEVFAYDRPGYGESTSVRHGRSGRDGCFVASHLKACLNAANLAPPYILLGHSMGGLYALCYARQFFRDLEGLVLLDMRAPTFSTTAECQKPGSSRPPWLLSLFFPHHMKAELWGAEATEQQAATPEELGGLPTTVIASSRAGPGLGENLHELWVGEQETFAARVTKGRFIMAENSGHDIHRDRPDLVVREVASILEQTALAGRGN